MPPFPTGNSITQLLLEQGQRRARLAEQLGQIAAETQARNGQIWGNTIAQLGQLPAQYLQQRQADQEMKLRQQQMQMQTEQMQQQQAARNQAAVRSAAQSSILSAYTTQNPDGSVTVNAPAIQAKMAEIAMPVEDQASMMKYVGSLNDSIKAARDQRANETGDLLNDLITHTKGPITPEGAGLTYSMWKQNGLTSSESDAQVAKLLSQVPPGTDMRDLLAQMRDLAPKYRDAKPVPVAANASLVNPATHEAVFTAPPTPLQQAQQQKAEADALIAQQQAAGTVNGLTPKDQAEIANQKATQARLAQAEAATERYRNARLVQGGNSAAGSGEKAQDAKDIAAAIMRGEQPPEMTRLFSLAGPVKAELARKGYNLTKATEDWTATQKYLSTLNSQQQTRLRQAVSFAAESLPLVRQLVTDWDSAGLPVLSKANLEAAAKGTYGPSQQSLARRLKAQIADLTSELGTVYKGGNSSTDESLRLAAENLQADWSKKAALDAIDQIDKNLTIRTNSMSNTGVAGVTNNQYAPQPVAGAKRYNPSTGKIE